VLLRLLRTVSALVLAAAPGAAQDPAALRDVEKERFLLEAEIVRTLYDLPPRSTAP
jgi:hypothetical protein